MSHCPRLARISYSEYAFYFGKRVVTLAPLAKKNLFFLLQMLPPAEKACQHGEQLGNF